MKDRAINSGKWKKIRLTVLDRDGWLCAMCHKPADTVDHIYPRVKGGSMWALDNLQCLCKSCKIIAGQTAWRKMVQIHIDRSKYNHNRPHSYGLQYM